MVQVRNYEYLKHLNITKLLGHFLAPLKEEGGPLCLLPLGIRHVCQAKLSWFKWPLGVFLGPENIILLFILIS